MFTNYPEYIWSGEFVDRRNAWRYRVYVYQYKEVSDASAAAAMTPTEAGELKFPGESPLVVEWKKTEVLEPLEGSVATLRLISETDRAYYGLYSITPGGVRMAVDRQKLTWRSGGENAAGAQGEWTGGPWSAYWRGTLDPEFYTEPYSREAGYVVELTFSDFGILERTPFTGESLNYTTLNGIVGMAFTAAYLQSPVHQCQLPIEWWVSTSIPGAGTDPTFENRLGVMDDVFMGDETQSIADVLRAMLQPLGLKMRQNVRHLYQNQTQVRGTSLVVYDLNSLYMSRERLAQEIRWAGEDQEISAAAVANNIEIEFDPQATGEIMGSEIEYLAPTPDGLCHVPTTASPLLGTLGTSMEGYPDIADPEADDYQEYATVLKDYARTERSRSGELSHLDDFDFNIFFTSKAAKGVKAIGRQCRYFKTVPISGSEENEGVAAYALPVCASLSDAREATEAEPLVGRGAKTSIVAPEDADNYVMIAESSPIVGLDTDSATEFSLRLELQMLIDVRYNWTQTESGNNDSDAYNTAKSRWNLILIPVQVTLTDTNGDVTHYLKYGSGRRRGDEKTYSFSYACHWETGTPPSEEGNTPQLSLLYFDYDDLEDGNAAFGWKTNADATCTLTQHSVGSIYRSVILTERKGNGLSIPYPPAGGRVRVKVYDAVRSYDADSGTWSVGGTPAGFTATSPAYRWRLMKAPKIELVRAGIRGREIDTDAITYRETIAKNALEEISTDTKVGTSAAAMPTGIGVLQDVYQNVQLHALTRAGRTEEVERLLIRTVRAQMRSRRAVLQGTAWTDAGQGLLFSDASQPAGRVFVRTGSVADLRAGQSEDTYVELKGES